MVAWAARAQENPRSQAERATSEQIHIHETAGPQQELPRKGTEGGQENHAQCELEIWATISFRSIHT